MVDRVRLQIFCDKIDLSAPWVIKLGAAPRPAPRGWNMPWDTRILQPSLHKGKASEFMASGPLLRQMGTLAPREGLDLPRAAQ